MLYELPVKSNGPVRVARLLVTFVAALAALFLALMAETAVAAINSHETSRNSNADGGASTLTVNKPANIAAGNFLMAQVTFEKGTEITIDLSQLDIVPPTGWVQVARHNFGTDIGQAIYRKTAHDSEPSSYTWTFRKGTSLESVRASGGIVRYTGVDTSNPIVGTATGASGDKNSLTAPSVAANADLVDSMLLAYFGVKKKTTLTLPSGMTAQYTPQPPGTQQHSNGSGPTIRADKQLLATAAAPGNKTSTAGDIDKWVGQQVALRAEAEDATVSGQKLDDADNGLEDWEINASPMTATAPSTPTRRAPARSSRPPPTQTATTSSPSKPATT